MKKKRFVRFLFKKIKARFPLKKHVSFSITKKTLNDSYGVCYDTSIGYLIEVSPNQSRSSMIDTVIHEYAHAISRDKNPKCPHHGRDWGIAYAKIYDFFVKNYPELKKEFENN